MFLKEQLFIRKVNSFFFFKVNSYSRTKMILLFNKDCLIIKFDGLKHSLKNRKDVT